jgi:hypothetical protein
MRRLAIRNELREVQSGLTITASKRSNACV